MWALISPVEQVTDYLGIIGSRIVQLEQTPFDVAKPLMWVECVESCVPSEWYYINNTCTPLPQPETQPTE